VAPLLKALTPVACLAAALLSACVTYGWVEGYMPGGPGVREARRCGSSLADSLRIPVTNGVEVLVAAAPADIYPTLYPQISLSVELLVPAGSTVRLLTPEVTLTSEAWARPKTVTISQVEDWNALTAAERIHSPGAALTAGRDAASARRFALSWVAEGPRTQTSLPVVGSFELQLPALEVDGRAARVVPIRFETYRTKAMTVACD
jgi:hypothetical protein